MPLAFSVCQKMSEISSIVLSSFSATATSSRLLDVTRAVDAVPEQLVQVGELLEVVLGEEVRPQHHQVMFDLFGALLLDDDRAGLEVVIVGVVRISGASSGTKGPRSWPARGRRHRSTGRSGRGQGWRSQESMQHGLNLPFERGTKPSPGFGHCECSGSSRTRCARLSPRRRAPRRARRRPPARPVAGVPRPDAVRRGGSSSASAMCTARAATRSFEARSDNPNAPGVVDSRQFGWVRRRAPIAWCGRSAKRRVSRDA